MKVRFTNLGCKLNQAELERLARDFEAAGHEVVRNLRRADLHVVNSCTVTHAAARDSRKTARRGRRLNPGLRTVLTGCYVAEDADQARQSTGADLVVNNHQKDELLARVHDAFPDLRPPSSTKRIPVPYVPLAFGNARALVKIEDGCNMHCAFCIIPTTRGSQRSLNPRHILDEVELLSQNGFSEVVLTGVQISAYRWRGTSLAMLVERILDETSIARLRLTSIAPWHFDLRLLELFRKFEGRLCRHFHLSLQSGSDQTLTQMRRPYTSGQFASLVKTIRARVPAVAITTDVIVGFPGETEANFEESLTFVEASSFARVHAFPYSIRAQTEAAQMPDQVDVAIKKERMNRLLEIAKSSERTFVDSQCGTSCDVLWETRKEGLWLGTTDNYIRVQTRNAGDLSRKLTPAVLGERSGLAAWAEVVPARMPATRGAEFAA